MRSFQANNCRLCQKVFCCKKCRVKHEANVHKVFPDCDICVFGKSFLGNFDNQFLKHFESSHLPVHCVYCKKVFKSIEELLQHKKCNFFQIKDRSPKSPFQGTPVIVVPTDDPDNDSPILQDLARQDYFKYILVTSTPMQRGEEPNLMFDKSKEAITPVDKPSRVANKSIIKKTDSAKSNEQLSKRRVTFGETQSANTRENITGDQEKSPIKVLESSNGQPEHQKSHVNFTPVTGMSTGQFYSAKTEIDGQFYSAKTDVSSNSSRDNGNIKNSVEGFTPVGVPNRSKLITMKIYKKHDLTKNSSPESMHSTEDSSNINSKDNLDDMSMELCTPAKQFLKSDDIPNSQDGVYEQPINKDLSPTTQDVKDVQENETVGADPNLCTPAKTSYSDKITRKGDIYKDSEQNSISETANVAKQNNNGDKTINQEKFEDGLESKRGTNAEATEGHDTLWLSAVNLEETNESGEQNESDQSPEKIEPATEEIIQSETPSVSPPRSNQRKVSIVMPTPILKTTNVKMKFNFPAHLASTPIMSSGAVKLKQTEIIKDISTRVIQHRTPYKTPQTKLYELMQRRLMDASIHQNLAPQADLEAGPSTAHKDIVSLENIKENNSASNNTIHSPYESNFSSISTRVSVSSMTESTLWTSMTRIVKSVFGGFSNTSRDSNNSSMNNNSTSFKRQLSDSDSSDFLEAPRLKRFKFTDIKCRRAIRDLPARAHPLASIEIVKSVSTLYGPQTMRIQCDKATQTDNYLLYGWHPHA